MTHPLGLSPWDDELSIGDEVRFDFKWHQIEDIDDDFALVSDKHGEECWVPISQLEKVVTR